MNSSQSPRDSKRPSPGRAEFEDATRFSASDAADDAGEHDFDVTEEAHSGSACPLGVLGEYLLLEQIGTGGMGKVYRAEHRTMNRHVALKILNANISEQTRLRDQFFAEIRAVAKLMHPNIVTAFDAGSVDDTHFLVMELVDGEVLSSRVRRQGPLSSAEAVHVLEQAARALSYAHSVGIVHRDIKPSNMMLTPTGSLKILDFGLARFGKESRAEANKNVFMGTPEFMSPEQIQNADQVDQRSDLYSLGATLYYLMTGRPMFSGDKMHVAVAQIRQKPPALFMARGDVDLRLDAIFQCLVQKDPAKRYTSAGDLLSHMANLGLVGSPAIGRDPAGPLSIGSHRLGDSPTSVALSRSTLAKRSQIVAIDLGMLASTAAYFDPNQGPLLVDFGEGKQQLRNILWGSENRIEIGAAASARRQKQPQQVFHMLQRHIGMREMPHSFCGLQTPPEVLLAAVMKHIMSHAAVATESATSAVVTVPACYDQVHRRSIRTACRIAGIDLIQLLDKPLAAALSWLDVKLRLQPPRSGTSTPPIKLLYVHLGGTGLEASVLQVKGSQIEQLGVHGSYKHGSLRWQHLLSEYFIGVLEANTGKSFRQDLAASTRLQRSVELALDRLTRSAKVELRFEWAGTNIVQTVTQNGLVKIAPDLVERLKHSIATASQLADLDVSEVDHVLLAGSMLHMKPLQQIIRSLFPASIPFTQLEKEDFARGAAIQAHYLTDLTNNQSAGHLHAVSRSVYDIGLMLPSAEAGLTKPRILLERSIPLPHAITRTLRPQAQAANASLPALQIIESTSLGGNNWHLLVDVKPDQIFPQRAGKDPLLLRLELDESGILRSSLQWPGGNREVLLPICTESAISQDEIEKWNHWLETAILCSTS